ncbi:hypothetical protein [Streptomyces sp. NBC_01262]|uniref:hypothetical protein n=1 Tax=Streptomyces sp. NBC_01262 TaxID=2903803 RepID=UPI002E377543|nr:hypothetical protein [Streptomyces sp. NBC_01262]
MAKVRFLGTEPHRVPELGDHFIEPDEVVEVPDDRFEAYVCQTENWEPVEEPKTAAPAKKTTAAKTATTPKGDD